MWQKIVDSIIEGKWYDDIYDLKLAIIKKNKLPMPKYNACYGTCEQCQLDSIRCGYEDSPYYLFIKAYRKRDRDTAVLNAFIIKDAWR